MNMLAWTSLGFEKPTWLWLCLLVPVLAVISWRSLAGLDPVRRVLSLLLRSLVIVVLAATLAEVVKVRRTDDLTVMFLMDRSHSVKERIEAQEEYIRAVCQDLPPDDRVGVIDFARNAYLEQLPMHGGYHLQPGRLPDMPYKDRTDIAGAIRLAMAMFPHDTGKRIVILSDGNDNMGDVITEAERAKADRVVIDVAPLQYQHRNEVYFDRMIAPSSAAEGEQIPLRMVLHSQKPTTGTIDLYHGDAKVTLPPEAARVQLEPGANPFVIKLPSRGPGSQRFSARFVPDNPDDDTIVENNRADAFSFVSGRGTVLVVSSQPLHEARLVEALRAENIVVRTLDATEGEMDLLEMLEYSSIILANVPANTFTDEQQQALARYVRDTGGGLIMTGGDEGFGAGGWIGSPVAEVMPVNFEIKHKRVLPRGALALVMHSCEMPRGNYWGKEVAKKSVDTISSRDYIGVLAYSWSPGGENWEVPLNYASDKANIKAAIDRMAIGDMPDFAATLEMAYKGLQGTDAAQKHVIILSDGDASPPSKALLDKFVKAKITISTIGIGYGSHMVESEMRRIARVTGGRFYPCRNPRILPQIFVKESKIIRRPLIIDEPFQPQVTFVDSDVLPDVFTTRDVPRLGGLVLTSPKDDSRVQMPLVRVTKDGRDPVLAHWQEGLGKAVAFTSGYWPLWGTDWTAWERFSKLWAQIVRWSMRQEAPANFETFTRVEGDQGRIVVEALDESGRYLDGLNLGTKVIQPDLAETAVQFTQTGPGHYEAVFPLNQTGQYIANVSVHGTDPETGASKSMGLIHTGVSVPFSPEFRELSANEALLREVADITGGRWLTMDPELDDVFSHDLPPTEARRPAWDWTLAWLLLPLFLLDVAVRRLASWVAFSLCVEGVIIVFLLWGLGLIYSSVLGVVGVLILAELIGWSIRWRSIRPAIEALTHTVVTLSRTGERSTATLGQLKDTREQVRAEKTTAGTEEAAPPPDRQVRYDAGDQADAPPAVDLHDQLGGAKTEPGYVEKRRPPAPGEKKEDEKDADDVTSRLLKAKRRAREQHKDED